MKLRDAGAIVLMALLAGVVSYITYITLFSLIGNPFGKWIRKVLTLFSVSMGITVAFAVEGVLRGEKFKDILLRRIVPAIIGMSLAYYFVWSFGF